MRRPARLAAPLLLTIIGCAICGAVGAASGADTPNAHARTAAVLHRANGGLSQRIHAATLDLYSLDSQVARAHARLLVLSAQRERLSHERASVLVRLDVTRRNARTAERRVAVLVRNLYEQQGSDPLAIVLGAQSLEDVLATFDDFNRSARTNEQVAVVSRHAKHSLTTLAQELAHTDARLRALEQAAARTEASLAATRSARGDLVSKLSAQRNLNDAQIAKIDAAASASAAASVPAAAADAPASAAATAPATTPPAGAHTLTLTATGYATSGTTATGLPVGWGTVAVDPSVIPLGTRLSIPGYGTGVAADTGSAVSGLTIDLWFPSAQQALAWGRRVVVVTLH